MAQTTNRMNAEMKLEALRNAGVNVENYFSMKGTAGQEIIARMEDGQLSIVADDDPIFKAIQQSGTVPNSKLFRRWVMAQMFHMLTTPGGFDKALRWKGYKYQWRMTLEELRVQAKMEETDTENFLLRNYWFNKELAYKMCMDYLKQLDLYIKTVRVRHCKGIPYIRMKHSNVFTADINKRIIAPIRKCAERVNGADTSLELYRAFKHFIKEIDKWWLVNNTPILNAFKDAYKGVGAYYTMKNLILFHGATFKSGCDTFSQERSMEILAEKLAAYQNEGWRMFGLMKQLISDSGINIQLKMAEWRK